jgi:hypothetical protein
MHLLSRAKHSGRQCHFKIWLDCHKLKKKSLPFYAHVNKVSKNFELLLKKRQLCHTT